MRELPPIRQQQTLLLTARKKEKIVGRVHVNELTSLTRNLKTLLLISLMSSFQTLKLNFSLRGLTFVPTPKRINWSEVQADINDFARVYALENFLTMTGS